MPYVRSAELAGRARIRLAIVSLVLGLTAVVAPGQSAPIHADSSHRAGELLVRFDDATLQAQIDTLIGLYDLKTVRRIEALKVYNFGLAPEEVVPVLELFNRLQTVAYAELNYLCEGSLSVSDRDFGDGNIVYAPQLIEAPTAWDSSIGARKVTVAVLDTGISIDHPEFAGRLVLGKDLVNGDADPADDHGHGTHVAGIIAAAIDGQGMVGIAPDVTLMPIKVLGADNIGDWADVAAGIVQAADAGVDVINLSLGSLSGSETLRAAVEYAAAKGVLMVAAAGNNGAEVATYPASYAEPISVAASTNTDARWSLSNFGADIDVAAPGYAIWSTNWSPEAPFGYASRSGTSQAVPHVSGIAALLRSLDPTLSDQALRKIIQNTAVDLGEPGWDPYFGAGRVSAAAAVAALGAGPVVAAVERYVNVGGGDYPGTDSQLWNADRGYGSGAWGYVAGSSSVKTDSGSVAGTLDDALFQAYREGDMAYRFDLPAGRYEVDLRFAEFSARKTSDRRMQIRIEGQVVESDLSVLAVAGRDTALERRYTVDLTDGKLDLELIRSGGRMSPILSGIALRRLDDSGTTPTATATATPVTPPTATSTATPVTPPTATSTATPGTGSANSLHVADLDGSSAGQGGTWSAQVRAQVLDGLGQAQAGARLEGRWSDGAQAACVTDTQGRCALASLEMAKRDKWIEFSVTNILLDGKTYAAAENSDPDGDSNGTTIRVDKP
jgi:thermitase